MSVYQSILLATDEADSHEDLCQVYDTAVEWAGMDAANLKILHTVTPIGQVANESSFVEIENDMVQDAETKITQIVDEMGIMDLKPCVVVGNFNEEVLKEKNIDLVVIKNDNEHYWGSKAEAILQSNCDILAVKS